MISLKQLEVPGDENLANRWNNDDIKPTEKARQKWTFNNYCSCNNTLMALNCFQLF